MRFTTTIFLVTASVCLKAGLNSGVQTLEGPWYTGSLNGTPLLSTRNASTFTWGQNTPTLSIPSGTLWTSFTPVELANDGDYLSVKLTLTWQNGTDFAGSEYLRVGLFNDNGNPLASDLFKQNQHPNFASWSGYYAGWNPGANGSEGLSTLVPRPAGQQSPFSASDIDAAGGRLVEANAPSGTNANANNTPYELEFTVTRISESQLGVTSRLNNVVMARVTPTDSGIITNTFNSFAILTTLAGDVPVAHISSARIQFGNNSARPDTAEFLFGIDFNNNDSPAAPSHGGARVIAGSSNPAANSATHHKTIGNVQVIVSGTNLRFHGANENTGRIIPGGEISRAFEVADFLASTDSSLTIQFDGLPAGQYYFTSRHFDTINGGNRGFAAGTGLLSPQEITLSINSQIRDTTQAETFGGNALIGTTMLADFYLPTLHASFQSDGSSPVILELNGVHSDGASQNVFINGFDLYRNND